MEKDPLDLDYLPPVVAASKRHAGRFALIILVVIVGLIAAFFIWAAFFHIDEITRGQGTIIPSQKVQVVANLEGGILRQILVKEGDVVEEGQILMKLDDTQAVVKYKGDRKQYFYYLTAAKRLEALLKNIPFVVPSVVQKEAPQIAAEGEKFYNDRVKEIKAATEIADELIIQKQQELLDFKVKHKQAKDELKYATDELNMLEPLANEGLIGKRDMLRLRRDVADIQGRLDSAKVNIPRAEATLKQAKNEKDRQLLRFKNEDSQQLTDIMVKLTEETTDMSVVEDRLKRSEVKAPMKGIVKDIKVDSIGGVVGPGQELVEIVPYEDTLLVDTKISPRDIAFIHNGLKGIIKVSAYDYSIYGGLDGKVVEISVDSVTDTKTQPPETYYRAILKTNTNHLNHAGKEFPIIPGMTAEVDIITGERTILTYLLKPIIRGLQRSLSER